jgi:hypothetical protein
VPLLEQPHRPVHLREQTGDRRLPGSGVAEEDEVLRGRHLRQAVLEPAPLDLEERDQRAHLVLHGLEADEGVELPLELRQRASGLGTGKLVVHPVDERVAAARRDRDAIAQEPQTTRDVLDGIHR